MEWSKDEITENFSSNFNNKTYLLSSNGIWLFRFLNGAFGSKWCGLWNRDIKVLDYFAFKVNGAWLSPELIKGFEYDGISATHTYMVNDLEIKEKITLLPKGIAVRLISPVPLRVEMEIGVNHRYRHENIHHRSYEIEFSPGTLRISSSLASIFISAEGLDFIRAEKRQKHYPGLYAASVGFDWQEEEQEKFIPGSIIFTGFNPEVRIEVNGRSLIDTKTARKSLKSRIKEVAERIFSICRDKALSWKFAVTISSFFVAGERATIVFAGYPYFNEFWTRDFLWTAEELKKIMPGATERAIDYLLGFLPRKELPAVIWREERGTASDALPLLLSFLLQQRPYATATAKLVYRALPDAVEALASFGYIPHNPRGTWMDSVARVGAVEIQFLWADVLLKASKVLSSQLFEDAALELLRQIKRKYWQKEGFFKDSVEGPFIFTANQFVGSLLGLIGPEKELPMLRNALGKLAGKYGFRAVAKEECTEGYHCRGWGLTTWWILEGLGRYRPKEAAFYLENYLKLLGSMQVFAFPETFEERPRGASSQLWSIAWVPKLMGRLRKWEKEK